MITMIMKNSTPIIFCHPPTGLSSTVHRVFVVVCEALGFGDGKADECLVCALKVFKG